MFKNFDKTTHIYINIANELNNLTVLLLKLGFAKICPNTLTFTQKCITGLFNIADPPFLHHYIPKRLCLSQQIL